MKTITQQEQSQKWGQLKTRFLADPAAVMAEANTATETETNVVLPEPSEELSDEELDGVAGGRPPIVPPPPDGPA